MCGLVDKDDFAATCEMKAARKASNATKLNTGASPARQQQSNIVTTYMVL